MVTPFSTSKSPFFTKWYQLSLVNSMIYSLKLTDQQGFISKVIKEEETSFLRTLDKGLAKLETITAKTKSKGGPIDGTTAFELYDTYGFPLDLTSLIAKENELEVDEAAFKKENGSTKKTVPRKMPKCRREIGLKFRT